MNPDVGRATVLAVVGPTAVGKSSLAVRLASELNGEVISADSRQVYRHMDVGTAKPTAEQRATVRHHLLDVADPDEPYSMALFLRQAHSAIEDILARARLPIIAGGTGQYVWGLLEGWQVPQVAPNMDLRRELEATARERGADALHLELARLDPDAARRIDHRNVRRVVRALEVVSSSDGQPSRGPSRRRPPFGTVVLGLTLDQPSLLERIDGRVDAMVDAGWAGEVEGLMAMGYHLDLPSMSGLGYREMGRHLAGELTLEETVAAIKRRTRKLARQQRGWFPTHDDRIRWFRGDAEGLSEASAWAGSTLKGLIV